MSWNSLVKCYADKSSNFSGVLKKIVNAFIRILYPRCSICHWKQNLCGCEEVGAWLGLGEFSDVLGS